ncbi:hypothetical protein QKU48_gp0056 [Fadolivirus algeromassiliense]|jgi:hypothetical protein|uniref:Methyltransferase n=1 Tax=Fadolivirus FV1/VV64 TaxID=3070911 RepID=A0A7D3UUW2_9VIRU|nr:hypothetical protein QKU48_gp0056 [Fadolivirus algeromassiliense]QKF93514.1 hypothetical protein Fadolivirus_1_56 [Fadolivirus FV1/VV64]
MEKLYKSTIELLTDIDDVKDPLTPDESQLLSDGVLLYNLDLPWAIKLHNFTLAIVRANKVDEIKALIKYYVSMRETVLFESFMLRQSFITFVGYAIPSEKAIHTITNWFFEQQKINNNIKLVDMGAGSGIWELLLHDAGIPKESLIAVDLPKDKKTHKFERLFWPVIEDMAYKVDPSNIMFIAWGYMTSNIIKEFEDRGGKCVIILGENESGCTYPESDYFKDNLNWTTTVVHVTGGASRYDMLTLNIKK